jgi:hypothetical protein
VKVIVTGTISADLSTSARKCLATFSEILASAEISINDSTELFVFNPVIVSPSLNLPQTSGRRFSKKNRSELISIEILYSEWCVSSLQRQIRMLASAFSQAIFQSRLVNAMSADRREELTRRLDNAVSTWEERFHIS